MKQENKNKVVLDWRGSYEPNFTTHVFVEGILFSVRKKDPANRK